MNLRDRPITEIQIAVLRDPKTSYRGVDELPYNLIPAAFASALAQASDIPRDSLPFAPRAPFLEADHR